MSRDQHTEQSAWRDDNEAEALIDAIKGTGQSGSVVVEGGWWPPGHGEPGKDWDYESCTLRLIYEDRNTLDVVQVVGPGEERALCSLPMSGLLAAALGAIEEC